MLQNLPDLVGMLLGFALTVMVFSYILGDNPFFRFALYVFVGVASGYAAVLVFYDVILYQLILPLVDTGGLSIVVWVPLLAGIWLIVTKVSPRLNRLGNPVMAFLVGAGAAVIIGGAVLGTLLPQIDATAGLFDLQVDVENGGSIITALLYGLVILVGVITSLAFFHFGVRTKADQAPPQRLPWIESLAKIGQIFIVITLGVIFAGVYMASLTALIERVQFVINLFLPLLP